MIKAGVEVGGSVLASLDLHPILAQLKMVTWIDGTQDSTIVRLYI